MKRTLLTALIPLLILALNLPLPGLSKKGEPDVVVVQHILIGFKKSVRGKEIDRTKKQARALAEELYQRALDGEDFDALVKEYTDDRYPGKMRLTNKGAPTRGDAYTRDQVVPGFGDTSFALEVDAIALVEYGYTASPFGWHVIKRLE